EELAAVAAAAPTVGAQAEGQQGRADQDQQPAAEQFDGHRRYLGGASLPPGTRACHGKPSSTHGESLGLFEEFVFTPPRAGRTRPPPAAAPGPRSRRIRCPPVHAGRLRASRCPAAAAPT